jgi:hypothetical protein
MTLKCPSGSSPSTASDVCTDTPRPRISKSLGTSNDHSCSTVSQVIGAVTSWGLMPITVGRTLSNTTRDFLGTFRRQLSAFSHAAVAARIEDLRTSAYGPIFR